MAIIRAQMLAYVCKSFRSAATGTFISSLFP